MTLTRDQRRALLRALELNRWDIGAMPDIPQVFRAWDTDSDGVDFECLEWRAHLLAEEIRRSELRAAVGLERLADLCTCEDTSEGGSWIVTDYDWHERAGERSGFRAARLLRHWASVIRTAAGEGE